MPTLIQSTDLHLVPEGSLLRGRVDTPAPFARRWRPWRPPGCARRRCCSPGDLAAAGDGPTYARLRDLVAPLGVPVVAVAGNHDHRAALRVHLLGEPADDAPLDRVVRLGGLRIVVLDTTVPGHGRGELRPARLG